MEDIYKKHINHTDKDNWREHQTHLRRANENGDDEEIALVNSFRNNFDYVHGLWTMPEMSQEGIVIKVMQMK